ncbi:hypothetical protein Hanom_Chr04g00321721 [Helianthus anomalus]
MLCNVTQFSCCCLVLCFNDVIQVHAGMLEVFLNQFEECVKRTNDHFTEGFQLYPESEKIKEKHTMWKEMLKKVASTGTTSGQPRTPTDRTLEKETNKKNVDTVIKVDTFICRRAN